MSKTRKERICKLLKGIETGDEAAVTVINPDQYIQHNPQTREGGEGLVALFKRLAKSSPRVNIVRIFSDDDYVFAHTEYDFDTSRIGFEIFRFEGDHTVEHWDNIQPRQGPNSSGHSMVDGPTEPVDLDKTEYNRGFVRSYVDDALISGQIEKQDHYIDVGRYVEHSPDISAGLLNPVPDESTVTRYEKLHRVLAEGNFVLSVSEGSSNGVPTAYFDLFRIADGKIVEHWDTREAIPPRSEWKNNNGKF